MSKWPYRVLGSLFDRIFRNNLNDNFTDIASDMQEQKDRVDNIVANVGNSNTEIVDSRGTYPVLRDRMNAVDAELAQKATKEEIQNIGNGSPKGIYATLTALQTAFPTGTTGVYLVTADGKWYYWNGSAWTAGGTYQSTGISDSSIIPSKLSDSLKSLIKLTLNDIGTLSSGTLDSTTGANQTGTARFRTDNLLFFKSGDMVSSDSTIQFMILQYNADGTYVGVVTAFTSSYTFTTDCYVKIAGKFTSGVTITDIPAIAKQVFLFSADKFSYSNVQIDRNIVSQINSSLTPILTATAYDIGNPVVGSIDTTTGGDIASTTRARTNNLMSFKKGDTVSVDPSVKYYVCQYTSDGTYINTLVNFTSSSYTFLEDCYVKFVIAYNTNAVISDVATLAKLVKCVSINNLTSFSNKVNNNTSGKVLGSKKWVVVGDSLTDSTVHTANKYHYLVAQDTGVTVVDFGKSGTGFKRTEGSNTAFYQRVATIPSDANIVTIFGGGNDCSQPYTMGEITDTGTDTLCGAINTTIDNILAVAPYCQIALISSTPWAQYPTNNPTNKMAELTDKMEQIAKRRGIKFLDLYHTSGLRPEVTAFNNYYFSAADGVHLNDLGHKFVYPAFKQLVMSMLDRLS